MAWTDFSDTRQSIGLLCRSLERGRLGHAYLFAAEAPELLENIALELAQTVNCLGSPKGPGGLPTSACGKCESCRRIRGGIHPDVHWVRAESKLRLIRVEQVREMIQAIQLKPTEAHYKVGVLVGADRLNAQAANAFLKTLEEPPSRSLLILLTTEPDRILETILSRCLRLTFPGAFKADENQTGWLTSFAGEIKQGGVLARYRLLDVLLKRLEELNSAIETEIEARSPAQKYTDVDPSLAEQWEVEAKAAAEGEYRRRRSQTLGVLQLWLRDIWLMTLGHSRELLAIPSLESTTRSVAKRLNPEQAAANLDLMERTQGFLHTNVQEALALEVAMLRLHV